MSNIQEKAEQYAREKLGNWGHIVHSAYEISQCTNGEVSAKDYIAGYYEARRCQPKHIFDGAAVAGEVRRFEDELVNVVDDDDSCTECILNDKMPICDHLTKCEINNVKYVKRWIKDNTSRSQKRKL